MFSKKERSTFSYWFAHWCAFQMTALNLGVWRFKYLFHDLEKPFLKLILPYSKVQNIHRRWNKHHYPDRNNPRKKIDWIGMAIDWECSRFTKSEAQMNAQETYEYYLIHKGDKYDLNILKEYMPKTLKNLKLWKVKQ